MKRIGLAVLMVICTCTFVMAQGGYVPTAENLDARKAFSEKRFGVFLHWGLYSMFAQGEWYIDSGISSEESSKAMNAFYPHDFDAREWVSAIKDAGAGYLCFTTRHHEGFSMWDTKYSDYNIMNTPYGKDVVRQLADACHEQDLGLHLYYSLIDWTRTDYPAGRTALKSRPIDQADWQSYFAFMNNQLTELLTNYGKVDCIWFDGVWDHDEDSVEFDWQFDIQYPLIHSLQPACLIGNNHHLTPFEGEDIQIFERDVPGENLAGLSGQDISRLPLETCQTMNGMWGYKIKDQNYKSVQTLIRLLARTASKGGNLLLNVGPQPDGRMPQAALERLKGMGEWLRAYGESIYATDGFTYEQGGDSIVCTRTDQNLYVHVLSPSVSRVSNLPIGAKVKTARSLIDGAEVAVEQKKGVVTLSGIEVPQDCADYVVCLELKD